jgi:phospholipid transport system substrate-binding protein
MTFAVKVMRIQQEERTVTMLRTTLQTLTCALLLTIAIGTWAAESPLETIRTAIQQAVVVLQDPTYQENNHRLARVDKVRETVKPYFDAQELAKRTLGVHWQERTEEQKQQFVQLFTELIEKTYSGTLDRYSTNVQFFFDQERIDNDFAEVDTRVFDPAQNKMFAVTYKLHQVGGKWLVYDVVAENVSLIRNYRNQFSRILSKSSYEELVQTIEAKLKELSAAPSTNPDFSAPSS